MGRLDSTKQLMYSSSTVCPTYTHTTCYALKQSCSCFFTMLMQVCPTSLLQSCSNRLPEDVRHASCLPILLHLSLNLTYTHTYTQTTKHHADIKTLKESYIGFLPNESRVFSLDFPESFRLLYSPGSSGKGDMKERIADQLATLCAFLGEFPAIRCHRYMIIPAAYSVIRLRVLCAWQDKVSSDSKGICLCVAG